MTKFLLILVIVMFCRVNLYSGTLSCVKQPHDSLYADQVQLHFEKAYEEISRMLSGEQPLSLKRSIFLVENAYYDDSLDYEMYCTQIELYKRIVLSYARTNRLLDYACPDSMQETLNAALFKVFTDTIRFDDGRVASVPFSYNFEDALGSKDFGSTFVTTLLHTKKGNCHSLPYLYRILTEELGTTSYLALAPMHIYIKQRNKHIGWYNVELTSGQYPNDSYLISTGFISRENIMSGLYMDTLSTKESVATCLMDLCYAYMKKRNNKADRSFQLKCAEGALRVKPNYVNGLLRKRRIHKELWTYYQSENNTVLVEQQKKCYEDTNRKLIALGYRDVLQETFEVWYRGYVSNKSQYTNTGINTIFKSRK